MSQLSFLKQNEDTVSEWEMHVISDSILWWMLDLHQKVLWRYKVKTLTKQISEYCPMSLWAPIMMVHFHCVSGISERGDLHNLESSLVLEFAQMPFSAITRPRWQHSKK